MQLALFVLDYRQEFNAPNPPSYRKFIHLIET